jgi:hypothetical protein
MKPPPIPPIPGDTPWERLDNGFRTVLRVPKEAVVKEEARLRKRRAKKQAKRS